MTPPLARRPVFSPNAVVTRNGSIDLPRLRAALETAQGVLLSSRTDDGHWVGELSGSALSTATAVTALALVQRESSVTNHSPRLVSGLDWLAHHQNDDGGWGDTTKSLSNLSTSVLCWAAFGAVPGADEKHRGTVQRAEQWLNKKAGGLDPDTLAPAVIARYGKDRTFSVPILTLCALAGRLGAGREAWRHVIPLPFELAACPPSWFAALKMPVVSYALPALIAIGQARHHHRPSANPFARLIRHWTRARTLKVLSRIQPSNGGFLEATPLTSFVTMSLAGSGQIAHPVTKLGVEFLLSSQRSDGCWPIDTNLATWVTTLSVNALGNDDLCLAPQAASLSKWLLGQQYRVVHPYTNAPPGGWAWTDLPGGVPDADDTAGALLALARLRKVKRGAPDIEFLNAAIAGIRWLLGLQNSDGGIPTFCRGWGTLPFDRSSADITAHVIGAWLAWINEAPPELREAMLKAIQRAVGYLARVQSPVGSWTPLWFGNQFAPDEANPTYGTARVVSAMGHLTKSAEARSPLSALLYNSGISWLVKAQNSDGGWGGNAGIPSSTEETALAVEALAGARRSDVPEAKSALARGVDWLLQRVEAGDWTEPSPIGFYFAKLWYFERLYPVIFTVAALNSVYREETSERSK